jgi:predicted fused transcriptional regulator/phosphomethylpyrimidine kinase
VKIGPTKHITWKGPRSSSGVLSVVSGRLNVVKDLKRTNQIVSFGRSSHLIGSFGGYCM